MIIKVAGKIRAGTFEPKVRKFISGTKMCSIVPQNSLVKRHFQLPRAFVRSLLFNCGFPGIPSARIFLADDEVAAR